MSSEDIKKLEEQTKIGEHIRLSQKSHEMIQKFKKNKPSQNDFGVEQWINIKDLKIDKDTQRDLQETQVEKIIRDFEPSAFGRISVSKRKDGYYITNGQHRWIACKLLEIEEVPCLVVENKEEDIELMKKQDARQFLKINNNSQTVRAIDKYRIGTSAQMEDWLNVKKVIEDNDCKAGTSLNDINAIACIYKYINSSTNPVTVKSKMDHMTKAIKILKNTVGTPNITHLSLIAMCIFVREYIETDLTTIDKVIARFQKINIRMLITNAQSYKNNDSRNNIVTYLAFCFWQEYNNKCRKDKDKLPNRIYM